MEVRGLILTDALVDRIHAAQNESLRAFAEAYARLRPDSLLGPVGTGYALDAGDGSPLTQCIGFGHRSRGDVAEVEAFFAARGQNWEASVTPFTDGDTARDFFAAGYRFIDFESVLAQTVDEPADVRHEVVEVGSDAEAFLEASTRAWQAKEEGPAEPPDSARTSGPSIRRYVAYFDGVPAAAASMFEMGDAVLLAGGATRVPYRGLGLQTALIARRLRDAGRGRLAIMGAVPGTSSFRNGQRAGFTHLYSTAVLKRH